MPVTVLWRAGLRERFQFEIDPQSLRCDVESREVLRGRERAHSFRLADDPGALEVRVAPNGAELMGPPVGSVEEPVHLAVSAPALAALERLLSAWLGMRRAFAAYVGLGERLGGPAPYRGYVPLQWFRAGSPRGVRIEERDRRLISLRTAAREIVAAAVDRELGGHNTDQELRSATGELVGVVVRGPGSPCCLLGRGAAAIGADADVAALLTVGAWLATGGTGADLRGARGVVVRPDAVEVVVQAARLTRSRLRRL